MDMETYMLIHSSIRTVLPEIKIISIIPLCHIRNQYKYFYNRRECAESALSSAFFRFYQKWNPGMACAQSLMPMMVFANSDTISEVFGSSMYLKTSRAGFATSEAPSAPTEDSPK